MNLIDAEVVRFAGGPYEAYGKWFLKVIVEADGVESETIIVRNTKGEIQSLSIGDTVQI